MTASSSDSWILVALTILVVLLLFYLSKKMICSTSYGDEPSPSSSTSFSSSSSRFDPVEVTSEYPDNADLGETVTSSGSLSSELYRTTCPPISIISSGDINSRKILEHQLRTEMAKIVQSEREIQRLVELLGGIQGVDARRADPNQSDGGAEATVQTRPTHIDIPFLSPTVQPNDNEEGRDDDDGRNPRHEILPSSHFTSGASNSPNISGMGREFICGCNVCSGNRRMLQRMLLLRQMLLHPISSAIQVDRVGISDLLSVRSAPLTPAPAQEDHDDPPTYEECTTPNK